MERKKLFSRQIDIAMERLKDPNEVKDVHIMNTLILASCKQIPQRLKTFKEEVENAKNKRVKLPVLTLIDDDTYLAQFKDEFFQFTYYEVQHLDWHIFGNFTEESAHIIGEILGNFVNIMSLSLFIDQTRFPEKGLTSLIAAFDKLKKLKLLKLNIVENSKDTFERMTKASVNTLIKKITELPDLEILQHNLQGSEIVQYPRKLSCLYLSYLPYNFQTKSIIQQEVAVNESLLKQFYQLPYLTQFSFEPYVKIEENSQVWTYKQAIDGLITEKLKVINHLIVLNKHIARYLPFSSQLLFS